MFTVVPEASSSVKPSPAGTVKPLMLTVVQSSAPETSSRELMVAVQSLAALVRLKVKDASTARDAIILNEETVAF